MVPSRFAAASLVAAIVCIVMVFVACELPLYQGKSRVQLNIASDKSVSARDAFQDLGIQAFHLSVAADGAVVFEKTFTETTIILEIEAGMDRLFVLEALSSDGPAGVVLLRGEARADIIANLTTDLPITLVAVDSTPTSTTVPVSTTIPNSITGTISNWVVVPGPRNNGGIKVVSGSLSAPADFIEQNSVPLKFGAFTIGKTGDWTYNLNVELPVVQALGAGFILFDTTAVTAGESTQVITITIYGAEQTAFPNGQYVLGDGSGGGGGGAFGPFGGGDGGNGGGDDDIVAGLGGNDVIFGDGSGGGTGGHGYLGDNSATVVGLGGSGSDTIAGGDGNDIIFGDGFAGQTLEYNGGRGGFGGGGGGGAGAWVEGPTGMGLVGGLGAGTGSGYAGSEAQSIPGFGSAGGTGNTPGGSSAEDKDTHKGLGGVSFGPSQGYGGGGGFGGAKGGDGRSDSPGAGLPGIAGDTDIHTYDDTNGTIFTYVKDGGPQFLTWFPNFGSGGDTIDGGPGSDTLFGLGGNDTFVFELNDAITGNDKDIIWDFNDLFDDLRLTIGGVVITDAQRDALIATQLADKVDRLLVFRSDDGKQVTIVLKGLGRIIDSDDFE